MREQRKVVTVLFCDVVGSTALGESTDPEALRARMRRYFEDLRSIVERHGGTVEKFVGDAVMAVFGIPLSHEDDALRAVRAATEMRVAIAEHGLEARIGVNTGEVVVGGEGETLVTGDAVNVAARLEQAASSGEALIGAETRLLVRDAVVVARELTPHDDVTNLITLHFLEGALLADEGASTRRTRKDSARSNSATRPTTSSRGPALASTSRPLSLARAGRPRRPRSQQRASRSSAQRVT